MTAAAAKQKRLEYRQAIAATVRGMVEGQTNYSWIAKDYIEIAARLVEQVSMAQFNRTVHTLRADQNKYKRRQP